MATMDQHAAHFADKCAELTAEVEAWRAVKGRIRDLVEHLESQRDGAKAAATAYPSTAATKLGEADAYDDSVDYLRDILASLPN